MVVEVAEVAEVAEAAGVAGVVSEVAEIVGLKPLRSSLRSLKTSKSRKSRDFVATNSKLKRPRAWPGWQMKNATPHADDTTCYTQAFETPTSYAIVNGEMEKCETPFASPRSKPATETHVMVRLTE